MIRVNDGRFAETEDPTRRRFIRAVGAVGVAGIAGCIGEEPDTTDDEPGEDDDADGGGDDDDEQTGGSVFTSGTWVIPTDAQFNPYNPSNYPGSVADLVFDPIVRYHAQRDEFIPYAGDFTVEDDVVRIELEEYLTWFDGEPVTADDYVAKLLLDEQLDPAVWEYVSEVEATDERIVEVTLDSPVNTTIVIHHLFSDRLDVKRAHFEEFLDRLEDAGSDEDQEGVAGDILEHTIEEPYGHGPFEPIDRDERRFLHERFDEHKLAEDLNFDRFEHRYLDGNEARWRAFRTGEIDADGAFTPAAVFEEFPDSVVQVNFSEVAGMSLSFQLDDELFSDRNVRRAFAHVIDREMAADGGGGDILDPVEVPTGLFDGTRHGYHPNQLEDYLGEQVEAFDSYEVDHDRATALLEESGFEREGDTWMTPDGSPFELEIPVAGGWSDWVGAVEVIAAFLTDFGIQTDVRTEDATIYSDRLFEGDFQITPTWVGLGGLQFYPYFQFAQAFTSSEADAYNQPETVSVPMPVGDPDGSEEEIDVREKITELGATDDEGEADELIAELAWIVNQYLPVLPIQQKVGQMFVVTDDFEFADPDDDLMQVGDFPLEWALRNGGIRARTE